MKKKLLSALLTLALVLSLLPTAALADPPEGGEDPPVRDGDSEAPLETVTVSLTGEDDGLTEEERLIGFMDWMLVKDEYGSSTYQNAGERNLKDQPLRWALYQAIKEKLDAIAAGEQAATQFDLTLDDLNKYLDTPVSSLTKAQFDAMGAKDILGYLMADCAYELYWFDKTGKSNGGDAAGCNATASGTGDAYVPNFAVSFTVAQEYRTAGNAPYVIDTGKAKSAASAASNAGTILTKYENGSDYEKMLGYANEICGLVEYNHTAADDDTTAYGNPWQLIWVFDGDKTNQVVCEGYSKAFQYLCDRGLSEQTECFTVTGDAGGPHMWNIVRTGGKSYLVDVTNSDGGTACNGRLILKGCASGSAASGYTIGSITYTYDSDQAALFGSEGTAILTLSDADYSAPAASLTVTVRESYQTPVEIPGNGETAKNAIQLHAARENGSDPALTDLTWTVTPADKGVTISESGLLSVAAGAAEGDYTVTATEAGSGATGSATVKVEKVPKLKAIKILQNGQEVTSAVIGIPGSAAFTIKGIDQYGEEIAVPGTVTWKIVKQGTTTTPAGISVENGVVTVNSQAPAEKLYLSAETPKSPSENTGDRIDLETKPIEVPWEQVTVKTNPTYGDTWAQIVPAKNVTAKLGDQDIPGTITVENGSTRPNAGENSYTLVFTSTTDGKYTAEKAGAGTVSVARKELTVTIGNAEMAYLSKKTAMELKPNITFNGLVGEDKGPELWNDFGFNIMKDGKILSGLSALSVGVEYDLAGVANPNWSPNYIMKFVNGKLTVTKATITGIVTDPAGLDGVALPLRDFIPAGYYTEEELFTKVSYEEEIINLPSVPVKVRGLDEPIELGVTWAPPTETYNPKGGTYTYVGTLTSYVEDSVARSANVIWDINNFELYTDPNLKYILTVEPTTVSLFLEQNSGTLKASAISGENWKDGLPTEFYVEYDGYSNESCPASLDITGWTPNKDVAAAAAEVASTHQEQTITLTPVYNAEALPAWATLDVVSTYTLTITDKNPVTVTLDAPSSGWEYGSGPHSFIAEQTPINDGTDPNNNFTYYYQGTGTTKYGPNTTVPTDAGSYKVWAELVSDTHSGRSDDWEFVIDPRCVDLIWSGGDDESGGRIFDNTASNVTAVVDDSPSVAALALDTLDTVEDLTVTVTGGTERNAGTHTATATLSSGNFAANNPTCEYHILKAERDLTLNALTLYPGVGESHISGKAAEYDDLDHSARPVYELTGAATAVTRSGDTFTAVDNGTVNVSVYIPATTNYNAAARQTAVITAWGRPVKALTVTSSAPADRLTAQLSGPDSITVYGTRTEGSTLTFTVTNPAGVNVTYANAGADSKLIVRDRPGGTVLAEYRVILSAEVTPPKSDVVAGETESNVSPSIPAESTEEVTAAVEHEDNKLEGVDAAAGAGLKAEAEKYLTGGNANKFMEVQVSLEITATGLVTTGGRLSYTVDLTPMYRIVAKDYQGDPSDGVQVKAKSQVPNEWLTEAVTVTVKLPATLAGAATSATLFARHTKSDGSVEILPTIVSGGNATWSMDSFSTVELFTSTRAVTVTFKAADGTETPYSFNEADSAKTLAEVNGEAVWVINGTEYTTVEQLLSTFTGTVTAGPKTTPTDPENPSRPSGGGVRKSNSTTVSAAGSRKDSAFPFTDAADSWARDAIAWAYERGYINGTSATTFNPNGSITRQQMWMILARLSGQSPANMSEARTWAMSSGVTDGTNGGSPMTRQQMVTFLHRYAALQGYALTGAADLSAFPDHGGAAGYAQEPLAWAVENGVVSGTSDGRLNPAGTATRAQFTVILQRFYTNIAEG